MLVLLRHGRSIWNDKNRFTGWVDLGLSKEGIEEALVAGEELCAHTFDIGFTSCLVRAQMTLFLALSRSEQIPYLVHNDDYRAIHSEEAKAEMLPVFATNALNERFYGALQGCNKDEILERVGEKTFLEWRRSFRGSPPDGESLEKTAQRALPWFDTEIIPRIEGGQKVLIVAHGNSLRAIIMRLLRLSEEEVVSLEVPTGKPLTFKKEGDLWVTKNSF